ncbi:MAG: hypothetical protein MK076_05125 [Flavobacteriales bacterium]|nr:hypothetical protein [Flavobacteriales bacterium]
MKKEITLGNLLGILIPIFITIIIWGNSVETRLSVYMNRLETVERTNGKVEAKLDKMDETLTNILIELQNKKNKE